MCVTRFRGFLGVAADVEQVNHPLPTDTCTGGQPCTVQWLDDGKVPLLGEIGVTTVGLYHGNQVSLFIWMGTRPLAPKKKVQHTFSHGYHRALCKPSNL
jgi:hypothetical protein